METTSHSMRPAREFWVNKGYEARVNVVFSKTRGKANGCIMISTGGEPGEAYRVQLTQGLAGQSQSLECLLCTVEATSVGECCKKITLPVV